MKYLILLIACCCISSCKTNRVCKGQRVGLWIETDTIEGIAYTSRGRYKKGMEVGKWRYLNNQAIIKTEKYRDSICVTTYYHPNGMKRLQGKTQLALDGDYLHWFYTGQWNEYDEHGKLVDVKHYTKGQLQRAEQNETSVQLPGTRNGMR